MSDLIAGLIRKKWFSYSAAVLVVLAIGFVAGFEVPRGGISPVVETGTVRLVGQDGSEFLVRLSGGVTKSYALGPVLWYSPANQSWNDGSRPACMTPLSHGQRITFGVVNVSPVGDAPGGPVVTWVKC
ncbi:MAG: hypothetical protein ACYCVZ_03495 [Streptosporangiaceae bacterium]